MNEAPDVSVISPAYNEVESLSPLYDRLRAVLENLDVSWEWIVVDDHSNDGTAELLESLVQGDLRVRSIRFSRNFGSHAALSAGLRHARGRCAVAMATDLQDPPEVIPELLQRWQGGARIVWAVRKKHHGASLVARFLARTYYRLLRAMSSLKDTPPAGADMWLMDRQVVDAVKADPERHCSLTAVVRWMGFRQESIHYLKAPRQHGKSKWSFGKKINHAIDTVVACGAVPIRLMTYLGGLIALTGFVYAVVVIWNAFLGSPIRGWSSLMAVLLLTSGVQMLMLGVLGEYLWRTYEESRRRPRYIVEKLLNAEPADGPE